jgi:hypothetical protein
MNLVADPGVIVYVLAVYVIEYEDAAPGLNTAADGVIE